MFWSFHFTALGDKASPGHATRVVQNKPFSRTYPVKKLLIVKLGGSVLPAPELQAT